MQLITEQKIIVKETKLNIEDALKNKANVSLKIEAAHAGVMNGNYLFYLPQALTFGAESLNRFYKPLQEKHYSKTLGYIYNSEYKETNTSSSYYDKIMKSKDAKELVDSVKQYIKTDDYENNPTGFGVLISKAKLHNAKKIKDLQYNDTGTVSVGGDAGVAYCSICSNQIAECGHKLGHRYKNNELCFGIVADDFEIDHISFETIPANWETNSLIITDSKQLLGNIELIEEGQLMKLTLDKLKENLGNIESVLTELNLLDYVDQYKRDIASALNSQFLLSADKQLPYNTPLTTYVTNQLLGQLEESEDKTILIELFGTSFEDIFANKTEDEVKTILTEGVKEEEKPVEVTLEPEKKEEETTVVDEPTLAITDSDKIVLAIKDSLVASLDTSFQSLFGQLKEFFEKENTTKANKILEERLIAYKSDLEASNTLTQVVSDELKEALINQIVLVANVDLESEYYKKLQTRSVQELKMTLEDQVQNSKQAPKVEPNPLPITDALKEKIDPTVAVEEMGGDPSTVPLEITDADKIIETLLSKIEGKLTKNEFTTLYKQTTFDHGSKVAKKLQVALKAQNKI